MKAKLARETANQEVKPSCEGVSPLDEPCNQSAEIFCETCERWFCASHAEDEQWHACTVELGDEGGEG
jgi:hypothetical protein